MNEFDAIVIGAGPGGYVAAIRLAQLGLKTAVVEKEYLGGVCLNVGCIPSKAMISAAHFLHKAQHQAAEMGIEIGSIKVDFPKMVQWKKSVSDKMASGVGQLLKGNQVQIIKGEAQFISPHEIKVGNEKYRAKNFVIATGSRPIEIPGFPIDEKSLLTSTGALALEKVPKNLLVIGGGYIGLEISGYLSKLGSKVVVAEAGPACLHGVVDPECAQVVTRKLTKQGVEIRTSTKALSQKKVGAAYEVTLEQNSQKSSLKVDAILVTVGRKPNSDSFGIKAAGVQLDEKGFIKTDAQRRTNVPHIYAIGDVACQPMLAHKASHEGVLVAEVIAGKNRVFDAKTVPAVVFTDPEIAAAGMTEIEAKAKGFQDLLIAKFPFAANGRATSLMETDGFVKIIADAKTHIVLGVHMVGPEVSNLISEAALAIEMAARLEDLALTIHPHPTLGETVMEAAEATLGHAIHIIQKPLGRAREATH